MPSVRPPHRRFPGKNDQFTLLIATPVASSDTERQKRRPREPRLCKEAENKHQREEKKKAYCVLGYVWHLWINATDGSAGFVPCRDKGLGHKYLRSSLGTSYSNKLEKKTQTNQINTPTASEPFCNQQFAILNLKELSQFSSSQTTSKVLQSEVEQEHRHDPDHCQKFQQSAQSNALTVEVLLFWIQTILFQVYTITCEQNWVCVWRTRLQLHSLIIALFA